MNRLLTSCLLVLLIFSGRVAKSQAFAIWSSSSSSTAVYCFTPSTVASGSAYVVAPVPGPNIVYGWSITAPTGCTIAPSFQMQGADNSTITNVTYPCCGTYTIMSIGINTVNFSFVDTAYAEATIICPNTATATPNNSVICRGLQTSLVGNGATNYTWFPSVGTVTTGNPVFVTPTVNTTYTMVGTLVPQGCTVTAVTTISVQAANVTASPTVQSMCAGSPVCFTATAAPVIGTSVTPGTQTTQIQWFDPGNQPITTNNATCVPAVAPGGLYVAVVTHTGLAGTCTETAGVQVNISNSITVSANSSTPSACPGNTITLTATSVQTAAVNYTWTAPSGQTLVGNPVAFTHTAAGVYTVDVDYFGCPGQAQVTVGLSTLSPTLSTVGGGSICPSSCATVIATGGTVHNFYYLDQFNNPTAIGSVTTAAQGSTASVVHCPPSLAATYSVFSEHNGCVGSMVIFVQEYTLTPTFGAITGSACPNSPISFTMGNIGAGANYSAFATYSVPSSQIYSGGTPSFSYTPPSTFNPPLSFSLTADSAGCRGSATTTVFPLTLQPTLTASSESICPGTQFTLNATGGAGTSYTFVADYSVTATSPTNVINSGTNSSVAHIHDPGATLPQSYTVTVDSANCTAFTTLTVYPLDLSPRLTLTASPGQSVCAGTTFTLSGNLTAGTSYTFISPTGTIPLQTANTATSQVPSKGDFGGYTYTVQVDSAGCTGVDSLEMLEFIMQPQLTVAPDSVCAGMPVILTSSGGNGTKYTFLRPLPTAPPFFAIIGNSLTPSNTIQVTPGPTVSPTTFTVITDSLGCNGIASVSVGLLPGLTVNAVVSNSFICSGSPSTLSVNGPTSAIYSWSQISGTNSPSPVPGGSSLNYTTAVQGVVVNPTVNTQYILTAVDPQGCTGTDTTIITINPTASLNIVVTPASATICAPYNDTLSASGAASYTWFPTTGLTPPVTSPSVIASPTTTQIYTVIGTNNLGCYGTATVQVQVGPQPTVTIIPTSYSVCPGFNATLTAFGANTYTWSTPNFTSPIAQQSVAGGPGTYTVVGSNGGSCTHTMSIPIYTQSPLNINVTATPNSATTCIERNFPYKLSKDVVLNASGAGSYIWQPYDPVYMTYSLGPQTTVRPAASTCYTVTGYSSTCSGQKTICVTVIPQFSMAVTPPMPAICIGDSIKLSISGITQTSLAVGPVSAFTYSWADPDPPSITSQGGGVLSPTIMAYPKFTSTYSVEVKDSRGCASLPQLLTVSVFPRPVISVAIPTINNVPTNTVCFVGKETGPPDVTLDLEAISQNTNLPFGVSPTYTWTSPYPPPIVSILTPVNNPKVTVSAPTRTPALAVYTVYTGYNGVTGCREYDTVTVKVIDCRPVNSLKAPIFQIADEIDTLCAMECVTFIALTDTMAGGPQTYTWSFEGGSPPTSHEKNPRVCFNLPPANGQGYNVVLRVENPYPREITQTGKSGSEITIGKASFVKVVDMPHVTIVAPGGLRSDTTVRFGTPINLTASGALSYTWSPNYNITALTGENVTVRPFRSTRYVVTGYNSKNCFSRDTIDVIVIEDCGEMYVPNAFSPNGDGHNEVMKVQGICLQTLSFMIFNRWGEVVFETNDQAVGWDGTYKGETLNTGVFFYRLEGKTYDGKAYSAKGNITLIR